MFILIGGLKLVHESWPSNATELMFRYGPFN